MMSHDVASCFIVLYMWPQRLVMWHRALEYVGDFEIDKNTAYFSYSLVR